MTATKIKSIGDVPYPIDVGADALSPLLTAGAALGITGNDAEESAWLTRTSEADGVASVRSIHGRTLRWNQLIGNETPTGSTSLISIVTKTGDAYVFNGTTSAGGNYYFGRNVHVVAGHKYLIGNIAKWSVDAGPNSGQASLILYDKDNTIVIGRINAIGATIATAAATVENADFYINVNKADVSIDAIIYPQLFDLTAMFGAGNEPATVAEFEALYPADYYPYDAGSLLSVNMEGIETVGFNQLDLAKVSALSGVTEAAGVFSGSPAAFRIAMSNGWEGIEYLPNMQYEMSFKVEATASGVNARPYVVYTDGTISDGTVADSSGIAKCVSSAGKTVERFSMSYSNTGNISISQPCIHLVWSGRRNGEYEPYWQSERTIPATDLRSAGTVYDEQTETERIVRVGEVALSEISWTFDSEHKRFSSPVISNIVQTVDAAHPLAKTARLDALAAGGTVDAVDGFTVSSNKIWLSVEASQPTIATSDALNTWLAANCPTMHVALATPTTTPIDPPLNMTYRTEQGGTERVMVPTGEQSAPPTIVAAQGYTAESLRDAALSAIAPVENGLASTNYGIGSYLVHGGQLCKVTTAIASGEAIAIGTNVTATTVMAEILSLVQ